MDRRTALKLLTSGLLATMVSDQLIGMTGFRGEELRAADFGNDFTWGVATAAYQTEGAYDLDGRRMSVWDTFSHTDGNVKNNQTGDTACDFYHLYPGDISIIRDLDFNAFRFSLSWSRIVPNGKTGVNQKGIDFYHRVIDTCLEKGIVPWITLYHWDLPQDLEDQGGWRNRDVVKRFSDYVSVCANAYGDKVKHWMVLNEPFAFTALGYMLGMHAPGRYGLKNFLPAVHHAVVKRYDAFLNRLFIEPSLGMGYPVADLPFLHRIGKYILTNDESLMKFNFDFTGVQNYTRTVVQSNLIIPYLLGSPVSPKRRKVGQITEMGWEVYPEGIYRALKYLAKYPVRDIYVTENGAAFKDVLIEGRIHDIDRIEFYKAYLQQVLKAKREGVNVKGYFAWSLLDNFEWAEGYRPRFGLVYVDFASQKRYIKDSGLWFKNFTLRT